MNDPRVRKDGRCARPGCSKQRPIVSATGKKRKEMIRYAGAFQLERDPFCSSNCARSYYGCPLDNGVFTAEQIEARSEYGRRGKDAGPLSHGRLFKDAA